MADTDILVSEMTPASQINTTDLMIMTQPDAQAETGYSTKSGTVLQVANKMLKGTEYSTDLPDFTDKTPLGGLEELKADIKALLPISSASGNPCTFETNLADNLVSLIANITASGGNGTPSTPIPLVGHSELNLVRCGVNQWNEQWEVGGIDVSTGELIPLSDRIRTKNMIPVKGGTSYYFERANIAGNIFEYDANGNFIQLVGSPNSFTTTANTRFLRFYMASAYGTTYNNDISINYPSTDTSYHAYNGQTFTVSFGQTVYGGVYDNSGKARLTHAGTTLNGSENIDVTDAGQSTQLFVVPAAGVPDVSTIGHDSTDLLCNVYTACAWSASPWNVNNSISFYVYGGTLRIKDDACADVAAFKAYLTNNPVTIVYPLATPIEIDVSELSVAAIVGVNNITSDCGGDVEVEYRDSIQHYIDKKIAETQALIL